MPKGRWGKAWPEFPASGKSCLGIVPILEGKTPQSAEDLERTVDLMPEWPGSYSTLGFKGSNAAGSLDVNPIEEALAKAPTVPSSLHEPMPMVARQQLLQLALPLADRKL